MNRDAEFTVLRIINGVIRSVRFDYGIFSRYGQSINRIVFGNEFRTVLNGRQHRIDGGFHLKSDLNRSVRKSCLISNQRGKILCILRPVYRKSKIF